MTTRTNNLTHSPYTLTKFTKIEIHLFSSMSCLNRLKFEVQLFIKAPRYNLFLVGGFLEEQLPPLFSDYVEHVKDNLYVDLIV